MTAAPFVVAQPVFLWILHHGQPVLGADQVGQPADSAVAPDEVLELPRTVQCRGVPVDVVMNVLFVGVGADEKSVPALQEAFGKFVADAVGLLRRNLSGLKGLPYLIGDDVAFLHPSGQLPVLPLGQGKFGNGGLRLAGERGDQCATLGLIRVHAVLRPVGKALRKRLALV